MALLSFSEYQFQAMGTASYPDKGHNLLYPALGLVGEAGETADKIKKLWRNKGITEGLGLELADRDALVAEIGDVLWYCAALATELGFSLDQIAERNIAKLLDRQARNVIKSEGDNR